VFAGDRLDLVAHDPERGGVQRAVAQRDVARSFANSSRSWTVRIARSNSSVRDWGSAWPG
jgi:hypothetical protein